MPLFRRCDGDVLTNVEPVRRLMPFLMQGRNESIIYHTTLWNIDGARAWLRERNRQRGDRPQATMFHLLLYGCAATLHRRPGLNRFVSGGRLYQRKGVWISFAAKRSMVDEAPLVTVKLEFQADDNFDDCVARILEGTNSARVDGRRQIDRELRLLASLPDPLARATLGLARWIDRVNLLPAAFIEPDPMYTSLFLANLGSIHLDRVQHHLYEYGTCSLFGAMSGVRKIVSVDKRGQPFVHDGLEVHWSFDERINDGFYCVESFALLQRFMENPACSEGLRLR